MKLILLFLNNLIAENSEVASFVLFPEYNAAFYWQQFPIPGGDPITTIIAFVIAIILFILIIRFGLMPAFLLACIGTIIDAFLNTFPVGALVGVLIGLYIGFRQK